MLVVVIPCPPTAAAFFPGGGKTRGAWISSSQQDNIMDKHITRTTVVTSLITTRNHKTSKWPNTGGEISLACHKNNRQQSTVTSTTSSSSSTTSADGEMMPSWLMSSSSSSFVKTSMLLLLLITTPAAFHHSAAAHAVDSQPNDASSQPPMPPPPPSVIVVEKRSIRGCPRSSGSSTGGTINNCVATSNIKQLDTYSPPWTFEVTSEEAFARLKGIIMSDPSLEIVDLDNEEKYVRVETKRLNSVDYIEFQIKDDDKVVIFQSAEKIPTGVSDFGAIRNRLDNLRKKSEGVFSIMGAGLTADSFDGGATGKGNGFMGQLKAFYGLNSGQGFESVFEEN